MPSSARANTHRTHAFAWSPLRIPPASRARSERQPAGPARVQVVDMFGSGLPVCALSYSCITELVTPGVTGLLFTGGEELAAQLAQLLRGFPTRPSELLVSLQRGVAEKEQGLRWDENWTRVAAPVLGCADADRE
jgi:beta-1,4-mannosyltransferase